MAGRLDSELEFTQKISECKVSATIVDCMNDYIESIEKVNLFSGTKQLEILSCWINDMQEENTILLIHIMIIPVGLVLCF